MSNKEKLNKTYGKRDKMNIEDFKSSKKILEYLEKTLDYQVKGQVSISEYDRIQKIINELPMGWRKG